MRFNLIVLILITSCIKQEVFEPKNRNLEKEIYVNIDLGNNFNSGSYTINKILPDGKIGYFNPSEIEAFLIDKDGQEFKAVFINNSNYRGLRTFLNFKKPILGMRYELKIIYKGDTISTFTQVPDTTEIIDVSVNYTANNMAVPMVSILNSLDSFVYLTDYLFRLGSNGHQTGFAVSKMIKSGQSIKLENPYEPCYYFPFEDRIFNVDFIKYNSNEFEMINEQRRAWDNEFNPFFIPSSIEGNIRHPKVLGFLYGSTKISKNFVVKDNSELAFVLKLEKDGNIINLKDSIFRLVEYQIYRVDQGHEFRVGKFSPQSHGVETVPVTYNKLLKDICYLGNPIKKNLPNHEYYVYAQVRDQMNKVFYTNKVFFKGHNLPNEIILKFND